MDERLANVFPPFSLRQFPNISLIDNRNYTYTDNRTTVTPSNHKPIVEAVTGGAERKEIEELRGAIRELQLCMLAASAPRAINNAPFTGNPPNSGESNGIYWQLCHANGPFPDKMVRSGVCLDGAVIYAGRAFHKGDTLLAKVVPSRNTAYVCVDGYEFSKEKFEVLHQGDFVWQEASNGEVPRKAVKFGTKDDREPIYMGRTLHRGSLTPGKVDQFLGYLYISFDGKELHFKDYEVLCLK